MADPLEELEKQYEEQQPSNEEPAEEETTAEEVEESPEEEPKEDERPPGYMTYEEWIEAGKDPEAFKGRKAYEAEYNRIQENKQLKDELSEIKGTLKSMDEAHREREQKIREESKRELERKLKEQKDQMDVDGALETQKQLDSLEEEEKTKQEPEINPVIKQFITENPVLDKNSDQFNEEFFSDVSRIQAKYINEMSDQAGADLSENQILKITRRAYDKAKELNPELFESERNQRKGPTRKADNRGKKEDKSAGLESKLKDTKVKTQHSGEQNQSAAWEIYESIKQRDPKQAEVYAKNVLGE